MAGVRHSHAPAANTAATKTISPVHTGDTVKISSITAGYEQASTTGLLTVASPSGTTILSMLVDTSKHLVFPEPLVGAAGQDVIVTLAAGGVGTDAVICVMEHQ